MDLQTWRKIQELEARIKELENLVLVLAHTSVYVGGGGEISLTDPWRTRQIVAAYEKKRKE